MVLISKRLNDLVLPLYLEKKRQKEKRDPVDLKLNPNQNLSSQPSSQNSKTEPRIFEADARLMEFIRNASKPILAAEIENAAWFHNSPMAWAL